MQSSASQCPVVRNLISGLSHTITNAEQEQIQYRWAQAMQSVNEDATLRRAGYLTNRALKKYSAETMEAINVPKMARHLLKVPDRETAAQLTSEIATFLLQRVSDHPSSPENDRLRRAAQVCSRTADTIAAYPDSPATAARYSAEALTAWSAAAGHGIIHELHTVLRELNDIS